MGNALDTLDAQALAERIRSCDLCELHAHRTQALPGAGPDGADVALVLDAPGYFEDRSGQLLQGPAGLLVDRVLGACGLTREAVLVTSVARCRPPQSRTLRTSEIRQCEGYLFRELVLASPQVVVAMGTTPIQLLAGRGLRLPDAHGTAVPATIAGLGVQVLAAMDPRAAAHVAELDDRFTLLGQRLRELLHGTAPAPAASAPAQPAGPGAAGGTSRQLRLGGTGDLQGGGPG